MSLYDEHIIMNVVPVFMKINAILLTIFACGTSKLWCTVTDERYPCSNAFPTIRTRIRTALSVSKPTPWSQVLRE